jgi:aldehyde dehydrogenase (NAD+)
VRSPHSGSLVGRVASVGSAEVDRAVAAARSFRCELTRHERSRILELARTTIENDAESWARLITAETGLCIRETRYEVSRVLDVLRFAAIECLHDDGSVFSCDVSSTPKARKVFTMREPLACAAAITPFNHPLNQVAHKVAPAIAAGTPLVLKPSEKTPLVAFRFTELLYTLGLPGPMLSTLLGPTADVSEFLVRHEGVEAISFTGSTAVGRRIASTAGYKKLALELGGNSELIVCDDADLPLAARLAAEGAFRNSGQRCTAVKRILVFPGVLDEFTRLLVRVASEYISGDPSDEAVRVGTVIDEAAAIHLEQMIQSAVAGGARLLSGGTRRGALLAPTVLSDVPRTAEIACKEAFGPIAKIIPVQDLEDAIGVCNASQYGLATSVVTRSIEAAVEVVKRVRTGTVNVNEVPGYRLESTPFGGVKDSGLGVKEGVVELTRWYTSVKTFSLPW